MHGKMQKSQQWWNSAYLRQDFLDSLNVIGKNWLVKWTQRLCSGSRGGHETDPRAGTSLLSAKAERAGVVKPEEKKASGTLYCSLSTLKGRL